MRPDARARRSRRQHDHVAPAADASTRSALNHSAAPIAWAGQAVWPELALETMLLGRFQLRCVLGFGASAVVFEAFDHTTKQTLALKVLRHNDPAALYRLKLEFRALAEIAHPNLVAMHELFVDERQRGFFTMELVRGRSFLDFVRPADGPCDEVRLRACLRQLARGVRYLHERDKLHCDLKPSNVLVTEAGRVCIVDFGLVQSLGESAAWPSGFAGTPAYAAPEQIDPQRIGPASDWYAVGVMLYEALAGVRPLAGNGRELLAQKAQLAPLPPSRHVAGLSAPLEALCLHLLEREPARRCDGLQLMAAMGGDDPTDEPADLAELSCAFVGRERELLQLEAAFELSLSGRPSALVLRGESGIGKSRLAAHQLQALETSGRAHVLQARCFVAEALHFNAFDGIVDALSSRLRALPASELTRVLPADVAALAQVFPVLRRVPAVAMAHRHAASLDARDLRVLAFAALRELLQRMAADTPLVLFIDNAHWADTDSTRLLAELIEPPLPRVWLLATFCSNCDAPLSRDPALAPRLTWLTLGPLPEAAVIALARPLVADADPARLSAIARRSGGHPLLAQELIRQAASDPSAPAPAELAIETALARRLAPLSAAGRALLELVCVAGQRMPRELLFRSPALASLGALRELRLRCALRESLLAGEVQLEPYHDSVRQVIDAALAPERRRELHALVAELLRSQGDAHLERVVAHYVLAGRAREAAGLAERAAARATAQLAFHRAASLLELALEYASGPAEQQRLGVAAGEACDRAGRTLAAARHYEAAADRAGRARSIAAGGVSETPRPDRESGLGRAAVNGRHNPAAVSCNDDYDAISGNSTTPAGELRLRALVDYCVSGHAREGHALLARLANELGVPIDFAPMPRWRGLLSFAILIVSGAPFLQKPEASRPRDSGTALRLLWRAAPALLVTDPILACHFISRALALAAREGERAVYGQALSFHLTLLTLVYGRRSWLLDRHFARANALVLSDGDGWEQAFVRVMHGGAALLWGDPQRAVEMCMEIALRNELAGPFAACVRMCARSIAATALYNLGQVARLAELGEAWIKQAADSGDRHLEIGLRVVTANRHLRRDDPARAWAELDVVAQIEIDYLHAAFTDPWWEASIRLYQGQPDRALAACERMRAGFDHYAIHSDPTRVEWLQIEGCCAAGMAARNLAREQSLALLERCVRAARRAVSVLAPPTAAQLDAALSLLRGQPRRARAQLRRAISACDASGLRLRAASLRLALAPLEPDQTFALERAALAVFAEEGIKNPLRWAYMLAPGLVRDPG